MRVLIKLFIAVFACTLTSALNAQNFRVKAGLNLSNIHKTRLLPTYSYDEREEYNTRHGIHLGAIAEFPMNQKFSFETGLILSNKGFQRIQEVKFWTSPSDIIEGNYDLIYLDIPFTGRISFEMGKAIIYGKFGPYVGIGLSGKVVNIINYYGAGYLEASENDIKWGNDEAEDDFKRLDPGLTAGAGLEIHSIHLSIDYGLGLGDILPSSNSTISLYNRVLGVSLGYKFGRKKKPIME
ncbi:MAG: hypothetical protein CVT94_07640 [Bacteroidetes bacterium HGW-Bacteroidetes-11]|jgi:hypothetical protein|nr:MAG: hypothetical protein CVT94_07640 [Bacteroidetes bacterium HGW-Bacteroidetes-11]